jgi:hypothetical protein
MVSEELCTKRLVFVDEMGSNTSLHELYAYSPRGERAYCSVARNRGKNTTLQTDSRCRRHMAVTALSRNPIRGILLNLRKIVAVLAWGGYAGEPR